MYTPQVHSLTCYCTSCRFQIALIKDGSTNDFLRNVSCDSNIFSCELSYYYMPNVWNYGLRGLVLGLTCLLDRLMYGSWVLVPLNFLKFNFLSSGGDYYGTHEWHWYFTQGFSVMLFTFIPFSIYGIILSKQWKLSGLIIWVLVLYSVLGHKEFR